jgi:glycosyltransferase involved in cell wall biosynthesis
MSAPKVALVHHWLVSPGGAERVLYELHQMWPSAPIYTAAYSPEKFPEFANADVRPTWLNKVPFAKTKHQLFPVLRGLSFKMLDLSKYDLVISSCAAEAKFVKTGPNTLHICYCHTPIRYYWSDYEWYLEHPPFGALNPIAKIVLPLMIGYLRRLDYQAAQSVDFYVANSGTVQERISKYYKRESVVIYPPILTKPLLQLPRTADGYYLVVGRQVAYKRLDLAVDTFNRLGLKLKVVGVGEEVNRQKLRSKSNIEYLGWVPDEDRNRLFAGALGFIWPQEEDFGMTALEAMAAGCPVIAYNRGGAQEYMTDSETGVLFDEQTVSSLTKAIRRFEAIDFDEMKVRDRAKEYDVAVFRQKLQSFVSEKMLEFNEAGKIPNNHVPEPK